MQIPFATGNYRRIEGDLPELRVKNFYGEEAPTEDSGVALQSRPPLVANGSMAAPVQQLFRRDLVLGSTLYGVAGGYLYNGSTQVGAIDGTEFTSMAGNEIGLMVTSGGTLYFYDGTVLLPVVFPDDADVAHITTGGSRFWAVRKNTGKLYWTDPLESDVEALDFLTAESLPDRLLQSLWIDGGLIAFGKESIEFYQQTGNAELPIKPLINMVIEKGIKQTGCACAYGHTFAFVTNENQVCIQSERQVISDPGLERRIEQSANVTLFTFLIGGTEFLALRYDTGTEVWVRGKWYEFTSYGYANWLPTCWADGIFGASSGELLEWGEGHEDYDQTVLDRTFRAGFALHDSGVRVSNLEVRCNPGQTPYLNGQYAEPFLEMRHSRDGGQTWSDWFPGSVGKQGEYAKRVRWRGLGKFSQPGFLAEFRMTAPVPLRVSDVRLNEKWGGR